MGNAILIVMNALIWGGWTFSFASGGVHSATQAWWYIYGPHVVLAATTAAPTLALATGRIQHGTARVALTGFLIVTLVGFLPYAFLSFGGV